MSETKERDVKRLVAIGLVASILFVVVGTLFLSYAMETLDVMAEELGIFGENLLASPFPEYVILGYEDNVAASIALGVASTFLLFAVAWGVGKILVGRKAQMPARAN
ncbi:MAG: hypothetical protein NO516_04835, partial [Candidatus Methanomethylicia archaeon]|nr:hypothetical protein [Candidatus Methanomethylicia archaeon]